MSENTKIEWADHTFNPWEGCQKVGPGCDHCYAENRNARFAGGTAINWGPGAQRRRTSTANWRKPLVWDANHDAFFAEHGHRQRVFCASPGDWADTAAPSVWRIDLAGVIKQTSNLIWLLLTKRIGNAKAMLAEMFPDGVPDNVWLGATICNQAEADRDIPKLLAVPAAKRFLSMEPLLGPVDLTAIGQYTNSSLNIDALFGSETRGILAMSPSEGSSMVSTTFGGPRVDWVIVGGESGHNARPMHPNWVRSLRDQCETAGVPFLFKQWGEWIPYEDSAQPPFKWSQHGHEIDGHVLPDFESEDGQNQREWHCDWSDMLLARRVGKKAAGRLLDGQEWNGAPS